MESKPRSVPEACDPAHRALGYQEPQPQLEGSCAGSRGVGRGGCLWPPFSKSPPCALQGLLFTITFSFPFLSPCLTVNTLRMASLPSDKASGDFRPSHFYFCKGQKQRSLGMSQSHSLVPPTLT